MTEIDWRARAEAAEAERDRWKERAEAAAATRNEIAMQRDRALDDLIAAEARITAAREVCKGIYGLRPMDAYMRGRVSVAERVIGALDGAALVEPVGEPPRRSCTPTEPGDAT